MATPTAAQKLIDQAVSELRQTIIGYKHLNLPPTGHWATALKALDRARVLAGKPVAGKPPVQGKPKIVLGPLIPGGATVLNHDLTHETDGYTEFGSCWPAFDEMAKPGTKITAPETLIVTGWGSAQGGESLHARGESNLKYWFGHVYKRKPVDSKVARGAIVCYVSPEHPEPHCHLAIDGIPVLGHDFAHQKDYSHGAMKIGDQLAKAGY